MSRLQVTEHRLAALAVFVVAAFLLLTWRTEVQDDSIRKTALHQRLYEYRACGIRNDNIERLNKFYAGMSEIERRNPYQAISPETIAQRIRLYQGAQLTVVDCGRKPHA